MVEIAGRTLALDGLKRSVLKLALKASLPLVGVLLVFYGCTAHVAVNEWGVEQRKIGTRQGIVENAYGPGRYVMLPGTTMHTFSREIHLLDATQDRAEAKAKAKSSDQTRRIDAYFDERDEVLGRGTHRAIDALNIQTSDGYAVQADVSLLYSIKDPVRVAKDFGWGTLYVDSFVINTFRNSVLQTLGKLNAEAFYNEVVRIAAVNEAEKLLRARFAERGFDVEHLLLRSYRYAPNYEESLHDKKVAVQLAEKNRKESLVNEEKAKLQQIESKGNAAITIAEAEVQVRIAKLRAEAQLYSSQVRAKADKEYNLAAAEAKRLKANALQQSGGRYVVAMESAKMLDSIEAAVMTPEQYIAFVRSAWSLIGLSGGVR